MQLRIFLTHKVIPGTFPLLKIALGKQGTYMLLSVGITKTFSLKNSKSNLLLAFFANFHKFT